MCFSARNRLYEQCKQTTWKQYGKRVVCMIHCLFWLVNYLLNYYHYLFTELLFPSMFTLISVYASVYVFIYLNNIYFCVTKSFLLSLLNIHWIVTDLNIHLPVCSVPFLCTSVYVYVLVWCDFCCCCRVIVTESVQCSNDELWYVYFRRMSLMFCPSDVCPGTVPSSERRETKEFSSENLSWVSCRTYTVTDSSGSQKGGGRGRGWRGCMQSVSSEIV